MLFTLNVIYNRDSQFPTLCTPVRHKSMIKLHPKFVQSVSLNVWVRLIYWGLWLCLNVVFQGSRRARQSNFTVTFHKFFTVIFAGASHCYEMCFFFAELVGKTCSLSMPALNSEVESNWGPFKHEVISSGDIPHLESKWKHFCWYSCWKFRIKTRKAN